MPHGFLLCLKFGFELVIGLPHIKLNGQVELPADLVTSKSIWPLKMG